MLSDFFSKNSIQAVVGNYEVEGRMVYYASIGEDRLPAMVCIHDSPGSLKDFLPLYTDHELTKRFSIYAIDRPGYGLTKGEAEATAQKQAEIISILSNRVHRVHQPLIVVAQGYGAFIAIRMAMDNPHLIQGLMLLDLTLKGREKTSVFISLVKKFLPQKKRPAKFEMASREKREQSKELKNMFSLWQKITVPVFCLYSEKNAQIISDVKFLKERFVHVLQLDIHYIK